MSPNVKDTRSNPTHYIRQMKGIYGDWEMIKKLKSDRCSQRMPIFVSWQKRDNNQNLAWSENR